MKISNEFTVRIPIDRAWEVLTDLEGIAPCLPGAQLTGVEGEVYQGKVKIKVGPVISDFSGTARFTEKDAATYRAVIDAKGRDARSAGNASASVSAFLTAVSETSTKVTVDTDLKISGKLAQFGSGMIKEVSSKLLAQFVANLEARLAADTAEASAPGTAEASVAGTAEASAVTGTPAAPSATADSVAGNGASAAAVATAPDTAVALGATAPAKTVEVGAEPAAAVVPDPSAGEVEPAAGRIETAEGTPEPVAPLRTPEANLSAVAAGSASSAAPAASPASGSVSADGSASAGGERAIESAEPAPIDLLDVAGGSIYKRVVPVAVGVAVVAAAVIAWFVGQG